MQTAPTLVFETINGRIQISIGDTPESIGILVERDTIAGGTLLTSKQASDLGRALCAIAERRLLPA